MSKYQYLIREKSFKILRSLPLFAKRSLISFFVKRNKSRLDTLKTPAQIILYVTNRCNARCNHCFYWREVSQGKKEELTVEEITRISKTLVNHLATLSITGGEPFLRDDIVDIIEAFVRNNSTKKINIVTNGFFTQKIVGVVREILEERDLSIDFNIQVSLDGLKNTHDKIRKINVFEKAFETIKQLNEISKKYKNFRVTIETTISKDNLKEIVDLGNFVKENLPGVNHGFQFVRSVSFDVFGVNKEFISGLDPRLKEPLLTTDEMEMSLEEFKRFYDNRNLLLHYYVVTMNRNIIKMKKNKRPFVKCLAGKYDAVIWPNGDVSMCEFTKPFANLGDFEFDFYSLWISKRAEQAREKIKNCFCTHTCNILNSMQFDEKALMEVLEE